MIPIEVAAVRIVRTTGERIVAVVGGLLRAFLPAAAHVAIAQAVVDFATRDAFLPGRLRGGGFGGRGLGGGKCVRWGLSSCLDCRSDLRSRVIGSHRHIQDNCQDNEAEQLQAVAPGRKKLKVVHYLVPEVPGSECRSSLTARQFAGCQGAVSARSGMGIAGNSYKEQLLLL
jgi:hypothetical protein